MIVISVTALEHKAAVLAAINAGKDFFIEWPAGGRIETTLEIAQAARDKGVKSIVGLQGRQSRFANKVSSLVTVCLECAHQWCLFSPRSKRFWHPGRSALFGPQALCVQESYFSSVVLNEICLLFQNALADRSANVWAPDAEEHREYYKKSAGKFHWHSTLRHLPTSFMKVLACSPLGSATSPIFLPPY